ncbi:MAG: hypothetical protein KJO07_05650 [Deltaproteobacteria bacterium]|nr:hypothetical protein [Deltaproteobacteria bacterium]
MGFKKRGVSGRTKVAIMKALKKGPRGKRDLFSRVRARNPKATNAKIARGLGKLLDSGHVGQQGQRQHARFYRIED